MFQRALHSLPRAEKTVLIALKSCETWLKGTARQVKYLTETPPGQALSTAEGIQLLDRTQPVFVSSCDHSIVLAQDKWQRFSAAPDCDAAILTIQGFPGSVDRPEAFAYVVPQTQEAEEFALVERVSVKKPVSSSPHLDQLLVGSFWFRSAEILDRAIADLSKANVRVNGELYLDSVFDLMIQKKLRVRILPLDGYINWGDPDSLSEALYWYEIFVGRSLSPRGRFPGVFPK